jgi:hypothetical protein
MESWDEEIQKNVMVQDRSIVGEDGEMVTVYILNQS